jgi:hypothetical protein
LVNSWRLSAAEFLERAYTIIAVDCRSPRLPERVLDTPSNMTSRAWRFIPPRTRRSRERRLVADEAAAILRVMTGWGG